jgi:Putative Actinobacterial Holin-X, holin superfamily III
VPDAACGLKAELEASSETLLIRARGALSNEMEVSPMVTPTRNRMATDVDELAPERTHHERAHHDGRSLTDLMAELRDEALTLVRQEVALAKTEMSEKAARVGRNSAYLAAGGLVAYMGLGILLLAAVVGLYLGLVALGLTHATAGWLSPLIVGAIVALIGYVFVQKAISTLKRETVVPERTVESIKADKNWMKEKVQ